MALADQVDLAIRLQLTGNASAATKALVRDFKGLDAATSRTQASLAKTSQNIQRLGVIVAGAAVTGFVAVAKAAGDFEAQLRTINTIARKDAAGLDIIGDSIRKVARDTGAGLSDLTTGYYDILSKGITDTAEAQKVLVQANTLAIGGLSTTAEAVDLLTTAINTYGGDTTKAAQFTDEFAKAIERGAVTAADLAASYAQVGPLAASLGVENRELAAGYASLTAQGTGAAEAATQMASAMTALLKMTPGLEKLQKTTGKNYAAIAGSKGLNVALEQMRVDADKAGIELIELVGRKEALLYILQTTGANLPGYNADLLAMGDAAGTAADQMAERQQGLNFQLARLKALALDAGITIGSALLPKLTPLIEKLNTFVTQNQGKIEEFGTKLAAGFEDFADAVGKVDWQPFIDGLKLTSDIAKEAIGLFMSLPPDVQKIAIAALAVNKVTGGLGTSIVKDLASLALKSLTHINAANVTVIGANVTGGGGGVGPAAAGGLTAAGLIKGGIKFVLPIAAAVAIATALRESVGIHEGDPINGENRRPMSAPRGPDPTPAMKRVFGGPLSAMADATVRNTAATERLEGIFGPKVTEAAKLTVVATERAEAIASQKAEAIRAQIAAGDTHTEIALTRTGGQITRQVSSDSASERSLIARAATDQVAAQARTRAAAEAAGNAVSGAVNRKKLSVVTHLNVSTSVSVKEYGKALVTSGHVFKVGAGQAI